jgi:hypothetical protein
VWDPSGWRRAGTITILSVAALHLWQAAMLLLSPTAIGATCLMALRDGLHAVGWARDPSSLVASVLIAAALASAYGALYRVGKGRVWYFATQHLVLGIMAIGGCVASVRGVYLDGTVEPWTHISAEQAVFVCLWLAHTAAMWRRCWDE